jgi:hypothetical protein
MTVRTGVELIRDLREIRAGVPALRLSGDYARHRPKPGGAPAYTRLAKPFFFAEFFAAPKQMIDASAPGLRR